MSRSRNGFGILAALLVGGALFAAPTHAQAGYLYLRIDTDNDGNWNYDQKVLVTGPMTKNEKNDLPGFSKVQALTMTMGGKTFFEIHLTGAVTTSGNYNLTVQASLEDVTAANLSFVFTNSSNSALTVKSRTWTDDDNVAFGAPNPGTDFDTGSVTAPASGTGTFGGTSTFSFNSEIRITGTGLAAQSYGIGADSNNVAPVPAPAGLVLMLSALPVCGVRAWRRRAAPAA
jgi:hypothetical protein